MKAVLLLRHFEKYGASSIFQLAVQHADIEIFDVLVQHGADIRSKNFINQNLLDICISSLHRVVTAGDPEADHNRMLATLISHENLKVEMIDYPHVRFEVFLYGDDNTLKILVDNGLSLESSQERGYSPYTHIVLRNKNFEVLLRFLVNSLKVDVDQINNVGETCLHLAASDLNVDLIKVLVSLGADPNICDVNNHPPLWYAVQNREVTESYTFLLNYTNYSNISTVCEFIIPDQRDDYILATLKIIVTKFMISKDFSTLRSTLRQNYEYGLNYLNQCQREFGKAAKTYVTPNLTCADILYLRRFDFRTKNIIVSEFVDSPNFFKRFPTYASLLLDNLKLVKKNVKISDTAIDILYNIPAFDSILERDIMYNIFKYLSIEDVNNVSKIFL
ncbi:hypothetical protein QAD02_011681 [Eretmocerus hayati]|uniref:Uncharacterized protein n=1 Tax=Eretmocerus hayati TaxID=131215 RepID=A0ACC2NX69_9HYME|nr:hypothetical protein QAD02_011681 [Eretmocerus hayati]